MEGHVFEEDVVEELEGEADKTFMPPYRVILSY